jgi:Domain of unknown function (DUF1963)
MVPKYAMTFREAPAPITEPVTKFGGQPVWLTAPQWPLSRTTGNPMRFVAQIVLDPAIFGPTTGQIAYLFITDEEEFIEDTWHPDCGENAVVIQPGVSRSPTKRLSCGPSLYRLRDLPAVSSCEFAVDLHPGHDPDFVDADVRWHEWTTAERAAYSAHLSEDPNKIGGTPWFLAHTQFPGHGTWQLIVQLDQASLPLSINFGDMGRGYAFLAADGSSGKFLFQSS